MDLDIFQGMEALRAQYLKNIINEASVLKQEVENGQSQEKRIRGFSHQIYGSGSSYGFDFISEAGKAISEQWKESEDPQKILPILEGLLENLEKNLQKLI